MALADQSVTINAVAISLPKIGGSLNASSFQSNDGLVKETVSHSQTRGRKRHLVRIEHRKVAPDPFQAAVNREFSMTAHIVIDVPTVGYTTAEQKQVWDGFAAQLAASSGALITKVLGDET